jgi:Ca-activated chloride channel family protein
MSFLMPAAFALLGLIPVVVLFYLLKLRRTDHKISSTMFWRKAVEDLHANAPFQRLRRNLLLLIQLLIIALLVLALARPLLSLAARKERSLVILIDQSASMLTRQPDGMRLDMAKQIALSLVDSMIPGDEMMLMTFADAPEVLISFTDDKGKLRRLIREIEAREVVTRLADALSMAGSLVKDHKNPEIFILSDGCIDPLQTIIPDKVKVSLIQVGSAQENVGITALDIRPSMESTKDYQLFAILSNFGDHDVVRHLTLRCNEELIDVREARIPAHSEQAQLFQSHRLTTGNVLLELDEADAFPIDDRACCVLQQQERTNVLLVSPGNYFLEKALGENTGITVTRVSSAATKVNDKYDIVVFDNTSPPVLAPGSYVFINALPPLEGFSDLGEIQLPTIVDWDREHGLMRFVDLSTVRIYKARRVGVPQGALVLVEGDETPLVSLLSSPEHNVLVFSFDFYDSNLPLRAAFPMLVSNCLDYLATGGRGVESVIAKTGQVYLVDVPKVVQMASVRNPEGREWGVEPNPQGQAPFDKTWLTGFYSVIFDGKPARAFGVSLLDAAESNLAPRFSVEIQGKTIPASTGPMRTNREIWWWFVVAGLVLLFFEWLIYHRRVLV